MLRFRRNGDPTQLAPIQPVHQTAFAAIDDHISRPSVEMADHWLPARWTVDEAVARILATRQDSPKIAFFNGTHGVNDRREMLHVDQHAETARAIEERMALQPSR